MKNDTWDKLRDEKEAIIYLQAESAFPHGGGENNHSGRGSG